MASGNSSALFEVWCFVSEHKGADTPVFPGIYNELIVKIQTLHIRACSTREEPLTEDTDPATHLKRLFENKTILAELVGFLNGSIKKEDVIEYFENSNTCDRQLSNYMNNGRDSLLYLWTSLKTGKQYVGQAKRRSNQNLTLLQRTTEHFQGALQSFSGCRELYHAIRVHRKGDWNLQVLRLVRGSENINQLENHYIHELQTSFPRGYNMTHGTNFYDLKINSTVEEAIVTVRSRRSQFQEDLKSKYALRAYVCAVTRLCRLLFIRTLSCEHEKVLQQQVAALLKKKFLDKIEGLRDENWQESSSENKTCKGTMTFTQEAFCRCNTHVRTLAKIKFNYEQLDLDEENARYDVSVNVEPMAPEEVIDSQIRNYDERWEFLVTPTNSSQEMVFPYQLDDETFDWNDSLDLSAAVDQLNLNEKTIFNIDF